MWLVEYSDEFGEWWSSLDEEDQEDVAAIVGELEKQGPTLPYPFSSDVRGSKHGHMRELRVQSAGKPIRIFYAFDPRRAVILLIGGDKTGRPRFYKEFIPIADRLYDEHLAEIQSVISEEQHGRKASIFGTKGPNVTRGARPRRPKD
jgi:hypothetical protein